MCWPFGDQTAIWLNGRALVRLSTSPLCKFMTWMSMSRPMTDSTPTKSTTFVASPVYGSTRNNLFEGDVMNKRQGAIQDRGGQPAIQIKCIDRRVRHKVGD